MADTPCHYCTSPKRREGCHETCEEYTDWKAGLNAQARKKYQEKAADAVLIEGTNKRKIRYHRRGGKH